MPYSHPVLVQNSYWNPGQSCQVVINYRASQGSGLQTDLHELRGLSSRISFQDLGSRSTKSKHQRDNLIASACSLGSAGRTGATAAPSSTQARRCWILTGGQAASRDTAGYGEPCLETFPCKTARLLLARVSVQFSCAGGGHSSDPILRMAEESCASLQGLRKGTVLLKLTFWLQHRPPLTLTSSKMSRRMHVRLKCIDTWAFYCIFSTRKSFFD